jgi:heme/copper-type cytochrome/quinol oxidase subunit 4
MSDQLWPRLHHKHRESAMAEQNANHSDSLHPLVNMSIIGFVLMFVAAMWMFFDSDPYGAWLDVVVTGLFIIAIAIPALLWLTWRRNADGCQQVCRVLGRTRAHVA